MARLLVALAAVRPAASVLDLLDPAERRRVQGAPDPDAAATAHALLRLLLAERTGRPPGDHVLSRRCGTCGGAHGRPRLPGAAVSVSRTPLLVAAAVAPGGDVGVDVELAARTAFPGFPDVALGPGEPDGTPQERARLWARKEASLKADGRGLLADPRAVPGEAGLPGLHLVDVPAPSGAACAVATTDGPPEVVLRDGEALLSRAAAAGGPRPPSGAAAPAPR